MRRAPIAFVAAVLASVALPGCGGPLLFAELQVPSVRATLPSQYFPASDTTDPAYTCPPVQGVPCIQTTLDYDLGGMVPILNDPSVTYDLRLTEAAITLTTIAPGSDLSGIQQASVSVYTVAGDPGSAVVIASYVRPAGPVSPTTISVAGNSNLDLAPYLNGGKLTVHVELAVDKLTPEFWADVSTGLSLEVKLDWGSLL